MPLWFTFGLKIEPELQDWFLKIVFAHGTCNFFKQLQY